MCNLMYVSVRSCPSDGAESCTKCNSGFRMQKKNGYNVCVKQDTAPANCDQSRYSGRTAAYVTPDGHTCSAVQAHHTNVSMYVCMYVCMCVCVCVCVFVCLFVCMYVCMYVCKAHTNLCT